MQRNVVITGATRGLGLSLTKQFLDAGDLVFGISRTKKGWAQAEKCVRGSGALFLKQCDLTDEMEVKKCAAWVKQSVKTVDVLINNAGYGGGLAPVEKLSYKEYQKFMRANLDSAFLMCKYFLPFFQKQNKGTLFNISSMAGVRAVPRLFGYSASKFGHSALTQCIAKENENKKFKCITVCPGGMNTEMRAHLFGKKDAAKQQSTDFVAGKILEILDDNIPVNTGSDVIIRHGRIWGINPMPQA